MKQYFIGKSAVIFWTNVAAAFLVFVLFIVGAYYALDIYTNNGQKQAVPNLIGKQVYDASALLESKGLLIEVADSDYIASQKAGSILAQSPVAGANVKAGRVVYVTINRSCEPPVALPDLIRNSTSRIAQQQLMQLGFKLTDHEYIDYEPKDLVIAIKQGTKRLYAGEMIDPSKPLTIVVGAGERADSLDIDDMFDYEDSFD